MGANFPAVFVRRGWEDFIDASFLAGKFPANFWRHGVVGLDPWI